MYPQLPMSTLLSQALVAFTIEFDNEFEHRMPHRRTRSPSHPKSTEKARPWLTSMVMWANFMQYIPENGVRLGDVESLASITNLAGLERWRLVDVAGDPGSASGSLRRADRIVRPTTGGRRAQEVWGPLSREIEDRWVTRFGRREIADLREALERVGPGPGVKLPRYLPVVHHGMFARLPANIAAGAGAGAGGVADYDSGIVVGPDRGDDATGSVADRKVDLSVLLARVLLAFTLEFERDSTLSLPLSENVLRVIAEGQEPTATRLADIPRRSGISKEAVAMAIGFLERGGFAAVGPDPKSPRMRAVGLTESGLSGAENYRKRLAATEKEMQERVGAQDLNVLRESLEDLIGDPLAAGPANRLFEGLRPYEDGWRATMPQPETLPHHPMVLHRGGYPDGS